MLLNILYCSEATLGLGSSLLLFLDILSRVLTKLRNDTGRDSSTTLTNSEALTNKDGQGVRELHLESQVVARHGHLDVIRKRNVDGAISRTDEALRPVARKEGLGATTLIALQHVDLTLEVTAHLHGAGLGKAHTTTDLLLGDTSEQHTDVVTSLRGIHLLVEGLNTSNSGRNMLSSNTNQMNILIQLEGTLLNSTRADGTSTGDVDRLINGHEELLVDESLRQLEGVIHRIDQILHGLLAELGVSAVEGAKCGTLNKHGIVTIVVILGEQLTHLHLDQFVHILVINHIALVQEDDDVLDADLSAEKNMLTSLRHGTISCRHDKDTTVHSGGTRDHVLDVISVTRAVDMTVVSRISLILNRGSVNSDTSGLLFWRLVNISVVLEDGVVLVGKVLGDGSSKSSLTVINVTCG